MCETPIRNKLLLKAKTLSIPPSPQLQTLGYGTGVTVYKLERSPSRSPWVLKKISRMAKRSDEMNVRLKFEAEILKKLKHSNIVGFRAFITENDGRKCIALEDCTISLGDLIEKRVDEDNATPFPAKAIEKVAADVAEGLKYLHHEALILHCDMKSYNILVKDNFGICKICDFGVSMPLTSDGNLDRSKAGDEPEYVGTTCWCPPEVLQVGQVITNKADIYSYGLSLWEMIALQPPNSEPTENTFDCDEDDEDEDKETNVEEVPRTRPKVPCEHLDDSYLSVLQIYYICTEHDYTMRPNAKALCQLIKELVKQKKEEE